MKNLDAAKLKLMSAKTNSIKFAIYCGTLCVYVCVFILYKSSVIDFFTLGDIYIFRKNKF